MSERMIELGDLKIHLTKDEDTLLVVQAFMRHLSNQEVADLLGVSERTVRRWKREGRLPDRGKGRLRLGDLVRHLSVPKAPTDRGSPNSPTRPVRSRHPSRRPPASLIHHPL